MTERGTRLFKSFVIFFLGLLLPLGWVHADIPDLQEQVIYSVHPFDGRNYLATTFIREADETLYLLADTDNFLTVKKSLVYYWPESGEWYTDINTLNHIFEGTLVITDRSGIEQTLEPVEYTYFNVKTGFSYRMDWRIATGDEAYEVLRELERMAVEYKQAVDEQAVVHERVVRQIERAMAELIAKRRRGEDTTELEQTIADLRETEEELAVPPSRPWEDKYRVPPVPLEWGFVVNLPRGKYEIACYNAEGKRLQQTTKRLVVFEAGREDYIGYDIRPGDSYTRPLRLTDPLGVVYVQPGTDLYVEPFFQNEYRELYYNRMSGRSETGNPNIKSWVKIESVEGAAGIEVNVASDDSAEEFLQEKPYSVEQIEGSSLGFRIVPYQPEGKHTGKDPHFSGYHLTIPGGKQKGLRTITLLSDDGTPVPHSTREIRIVRYRRSALPFVLFAAAPIAAMLVIIIKRRRKGL